MSRAAERQRRVRARRKQAGLIRVECWVNRYQAFAIREIAADRDVIYFASAQRQASVTGHSTPAPGNGKPTAA